MKEKSKAKSKNPLYVVKGQDVLEASSVVDLVLKKFNLEPVVQFLQNMLKLILDNIKTYPTFLAMKKLLDDLVVRYFALVKQFGLA